jgi:hypothetical protein
MQNKAKDTRKEFKGHTTNLLCKQLVCDFSIEEGRPTHDFFSLTFFFPHQFCNVAEVAHGQLKQI